jgi:hypothetical protein
VPGFTPAPGGARGPGPRPGGPRPRAAGGTSRPDGPAGLGGPQPGLLRYLGALSVKASLVVMTVATVAGVLLTVIAGHEPGVLLGTCLIAGSVVAALGIRRSAIYLLFPMPVLAFFVGAVLSGLVHDSQLTSSTAGLGASFLQWVAGIFFPAMIATILVLLIGGGRWLFGSQLVSGHAPTPAGLAAAPGSARPAPRRSAPSDSWAAEDPFTDRTPDTGPTPRPGGTGPTPRPGSAGRPGPGGSRPQRPARDPRTDRDPWGDPRLPADRQPPAAPRTRQPGPASQPQPRDRSQRSGPSWSPAPRPAPRPSRPQPPEGWNQR